MDNTKLFSTLKICETDVEGSLTRFYDDEELYISFLLAFLEDPTISELKNAVNNKCWDRAFMAAHALKGVAANLGFIPLFHAVGELVLILRASKIDEVDYVYRQVIKCYDSVCDAIIKANN